MKESSSLPNLSSHQGVGMLKAGLVLLADQVSASFPPIVAAAMEVLAGRNVGDVGAVEARRFLVGRRDQLARGFATRLKTEQEQALERLTKRDKTVAGTPKITADSLSLMEDDDVATEEVVSKVARRMHGPVELSLRELNLVTSHLLRRESLRASDDPFAPEVCMKALIEVARDLRLEPSGVSSLLSAFERPLATELGRAYQRVLEQFRKHRVDANEIRREIATRQSLGKPTLNPATKSSAAQRLAWMDEVPRVNAIPGSTDEPALGLDSGVSTRTGAPTAPGRAAGGLISGFLGGGGAGGGGGGGGGGYVPTVAEVRASLSNMVARMNVDVRGAPLPAAAAAPAGKPSPDLISAINEMQHVGARAAATVGGDAGALGPAVGLAGTDQGAWREVLLAKSNRTVDKLTIEIVGMLFDHVLQDNQVPAEIKAVLSRLQFPVLKIALTDADFFASSAHPARRLIDRLASTAVGWEPYGDENQRYKAEVERVVQQVLEHFDKDTSTFEQLLNDFEAFIGEMPTRETDPVARAKRALEEAEKREVLVINTTIQVRRAFEHVELEPYLREFLVGPWVQALVSATLRDEQTPGFSKAFRQVIHDVVWSVQPKVSADERKRLVALIPAMTRVLRDGMGMVRMTEQDQQAFLKNLMASHALAVRPVDQATYIKAKVVTGELRQKLDEMHITGTFPISGAGGSVKVSVAAVKRAAQNHAAELVIPDPVPAAEPLSIAKDAEFDDQIASWQRGSWFNLYDGKEVIKVKLRWISPLRTLFMFSSGEEKNARVLSPETIKSYLRQGWLKPLETVPLTKRLVKRVVGELEASSKSAEELASRFGGATKALPTRPQPA
jgi:hypothetical protein